MQVRRSLSLTIRGFASCRRGNFALMLALLSPMMLSLMGGATDFYIYQHHRNELQSVADAAALAAAAEAGLKGWSSESGKQVAASVISSNLSNKFSGATVAYDVQVDEARRRIQVTLTQDHYGYFLLGYFTGSPQIAVKSAARATGQAAICLIMRQASKPGGLDMSGGSKIYASGCSAYSNSNDVHGVSVKDTSRLTAQMTCSAGGFAGTGSNFFRLPITDCPQLNDPLAARAQIIDSEVAAMTCVYKTIDVKRALKMLSPGVYCGDININDHSTVTMLPGIYILRNGKLHVDGASILTGTGVGIVFTGDKSKLELMHDTTIVLSAPASGSMAGMLLYVQPVAKTPPPAPRDFSIQSQNAQQLLGTVYLPADRLVVGGDKDGDGLCDPTVDNYGNIIPADPLADCIANVGGASSWTAIVAGVVRTNEKAILILNSNYAASTVPVPDGLGPNSSKVLLTR